MTMSLTKDKGQLNAQEANRPERRQAIRLGTVQIDRKRQLDRPRRAGREDPHPPCLDPAANRFRAIRDQDRTAPFDPRAVIGDKPRAKRHHRERERGLPRPRGAENHHSPAPDRDTGGVNRLRFSIMHRRNYFLVLVKNPAACRSDLVLQAPAGTNVGANIRWLR